jgi:tRNA A-37 threonylcarbamoyl transferase component Bud32
MKWLLPVHVAQRLSFSRYKGFIRSEWCNTAVNDWISELTDSLTRSDVTTVKDSKTTSLFHGAISYQHSEICVKRYNYQNFFYALKYLFRNSRAKKAWKNANALINRGISTPSPVAFLEKRTLHFLHHSLFISTWINDSVSLDRFFEKRFKDVLTGDLLKEKWQLISDAARYVRSMHKAQISHGDLKAKNILVKGSEGRYLFYLLDLDSLKVKKAVSRKDRIKDLSRLNASFLDTRLLSQTNRLRFLTTYLSGETHAGSIKKIYWKQIGEATENKLRKSEKRFM